MTMEHMRVDITSRCQVTQAHILHAASENQHLIIFYIHIVK